MDKSPFLMMPNKTEHFDVLTATGRKSNNDEEVMKPTQFYIIIQPRKKWMHQIKCCRTTRASAKQSCGTNRFLKIILESAIVNAWSVHSRLNGKKMNMLLFRNAVIDEMTKQSERKNNKNEEILPAPFRRVPKQKHQLGKYDGQALKVRKRCKNRYETLKRCEAEVENGANMSPHSLKIMETKH